MNRHQSNPFLSDWDDEAARSDLASLNKNSTSIFDSLSNETITNIDSTSGQANNNINSNQQAMSVITRRHSSSNSDLNSSRDRRLYHRNMSSFEAASLHQQLQENGSSIGADGGIISGELIAKMTAEFKSAMESKDKEFALEDAIEPIEGFNPFDPFETIVDDDISYPSPAGSSSANNSQLQHNNNQQQQSDKFFTNNKADEKTHADRNEIPNPFELELSDEPTSSTEKPPFEESKTPGITHDSIDDDDEELVSTPVRNIKSLPFQTSRANKSIKDKELTTTIEQNHLDGTATNDFDQNNHESMLCTRRDEPQDGGFENSNSIEKAHLYASLLDSAESNQPNPTLDDPPLKDFTSFNPKTSEPTEYVARVIKGSPTTMDGQNLERPVGYFDPFETVIDKDALTSLINDNNNKSQQQQSQQQQESTTTKEHTSPNAHSNLDSISIQESHTIADQNSIDTVIEVTNENITNSSTAHKPPASSEITNDEGLELEDNSSSNSIPNHNNNSTVVQTSIKTTGTTTTNNSSYCSLPRPKARALDKFPSPMASPIRMVPRSTPIKKSSHNKQQHQRKAGKDSDDSSSSSDDEHLKIVIKARGTPKETESTGGDGSKNDPTMVPFLPPPPSKSSIMQAMELSAAQSDDPSGSSPMRMAFGYARNRKESEDSSEDNASASKEGTTKITDDKIQETNQKDDIKREFDYDEDEDNHDGEFIIRMTHSDEEALEDYEPPDSPLFDHDTTYQLEEFSKPIEAGHGWKMLLRYPPKKKFTSNRFWKEIGVKVEQVPVSGENSASKQLASLNKQTTNHAADVAAAAAAATTTTTTSSTTCVALQIFNNLEERKPMQEIPLQPTYTVSDISSQQLDQFGKLFTIKLQYVFYKERVGVRQGQLARFIHSGHIGTSTTSGGHGVDPLSVGGIKRLGAPVEHSPQISQIIKLGSTDYNEIKQFKNCLEDHLFKLPISRSVPLTTYKTEEIQMLVRDETYIELNQTGQIIRQMARVRLFFLSFLNGNPIIEVGVNDICRQGKEVVGRMDILPVITEEWIRLEACELHSSVDRNEFENTESRLIKFTPPDATFFELMRFRVRPPRNRELPLQISANMSVTRTRVTINVDCMIAGSINRKMGPIPCENIAIRIHLPQCWIYQFREEKHFRMGSKKSVKNTPGRIKGMGRFLSGAGAGPTASPGHHLGPGGMVVPTNAQGVANESNGVIEVTSGQAKYEHHYKAIVWRAAKWPKDNQTAYVQNSMKIQLTLTAYDQMPETFDEYLNVEYCMPATTVSHTSLRSISVNPCEDEAPEKFVKYLAKYEYKVKMRLSVNLRAGAASGSGGPNQAADAICSSALSPLANVLKREPDRSNDLQREEDTEEDDEEDDEDEDLGDHDKGASLNNNDK